MMQVILLERIETLGQMGDVVKVKPGYARNFLLPQKKALRATDDNLKAFESQRTDLEARNLERRKEAEGVAARMEGLRIVMVRQAGDTGQLYGSVSPRDIAARLTEEGVSADGRQVMLNRPIKTLGIHKVRIALHPEVFVELDINIARNTEEADRQAADQDGQLPEGAEDMFEEGAGLAADEEETEEESEEEATDEVR
jgi:large subunit ribosomal protein L9